MNSEIENIDDIINIIGLGLWNVPSFVILFINYGMSAAYLVEMEFLAPASTVPVNDTGELETEENHLDDLSPYNHSGSVTFIEEFNLVDSREYLRGIHQMMYSIGAFIGCIIACTISNRYGRQKSVWYSSLSLAVLTILSVTLPWLEALMAVRLLTGICLSVSIISSQSIGIECCTINSRLVYGISTGLGYPLMLIIIPGIAYITEDWRTIHGCSSIPIFICLLFANPLFLKESPRWLIEKGHIEEAEIVLRAGAKLNKKSYNIPDDLEVILRNIHHLEDSYQLNCGKNDALQHDKGLKKTTLKSLLYSKPMQILLLFTIINGIIIGILYVAIPLRTKIAQSPYIFMVVLGLLEVPSYTLSMALIQRFGRKNFYCTLSQIMAAILLMLMIMTLLEYNIEWVETTFLSIAYSCAGCLASLYLVYISELYPTSIRIVGSGVAYSMVCIGYSIPPLLEIILPTDSFNWLSLMIYFILAFVGGILVFLVPETNKKPLLQSVQEYVRFAQEKE